MEAELLMIKIVDASKLCFEIFTLRKSSRTSTTSLRMAGNITTSLLQRQT